MALVRIQDLPAASALDGSELLEIEQGGASVQCTAQDIADLAAGGSGGAAEDVTYDNTASGLTATDVQAAIDELAAGGGGGGDVDGPSSSVDARIAVFDGTSGKKIKDGGSTIAALLASAVAIKITTSISSGTITPAGDTDIVRPTALSAALTIANPSSTPQDGWGMVIELKDNGTARALTWGAKYESRIGTLPTTTVANKQHIIGVSYNATDDKLYCDFAVVQA